VVAQQGYSGTPLPKKLGLRDGQRVLFLNLPATQIALQDACQFQELTLSDWDGLVALKMGYDVIHGFTMSHVEMKVNLERLQSLIAPDGMIWISWPKKASKIKTDITEDVVRAEALSLDLVDVKVCAVDAIWSGLKLVIRKERRHLHG
jgi:ABC-type Fe3+-citrate transport system substrate-binding protein